MAELSKSAKRRQRERTERLETILGAAEGFFAREGYHKTSIERIADEAEVSVGTVYFYFKNKEDLLVKLLESIGFELRNLLGEQFREAGDGTEGLRRAGHAFFEVFCKERPEKLVIIFRESVGQSDVVEECRKRIFDRLVADLKDALAQLAEGQGWEWENEYARDVVAAGILGTYERLAYQHLIWSQQPADLERIAAAAVDFIIGGIKNLAR